MTKASASRSYVITLVHGTGAKGAPWTLAESSMSSYLRTQLKETDLRRFDWSGSNSPKARRAAAVDLAAQLKKQIDENKNATHVIVCHSHGGDVSLRAAADPLVDDRIAGIVCLATPFVVARKRDLGKDPTWYLVGAIVAQVIAGILWMVYLLRTGHSVLAVALAGAATLLMASFLVALAVKWGDWANWLENALRLPDIHPDRLLIVRAPADEASALLGAGQLFSQVSVLVMLSMRRVFDWVGMRVGPWAKRKGALAIALVTSLAFIMALVVAYAQLQLRGSPDWLLLVPLGAGVAFFAVAGLSLFLLLPALGADGVTVFLHLAAGVIVWPIVVLMSFALVIPFGFEIALANILLDVAGESTPQNSTGEPWRVHLVQPPTSGEAGSEHSNLGHSRIYDNPRVHELIVKWIQELPDRS